MISINMNKAKEIFKDKIREVRKPLLEAKDVEYIRYLEIGDSEKVAAVAAEKKLLRDAPADSNIDAATNVEELKQAWNTDLLGSNPYLQVF